MCKHIRQLGARFLAYLSIQALLTGLDYTKLEEVLLANYATLLHVTQAYLRAMLNPENWPYASRWYFREFTKLLQEDDPENCQANQRRLLARLFAEYFSYSVFEGNYGSLLQLVLSTIVEVTTFQHSILYR